MSVSALEPETLLAELNELWSSLAREKKGEGLLRACSMTLLITADSDEDTAQVRRIAGAVMHDHPSRAIIIKTRLGAAPEGRVFAECRRGSGGNEQICSEGIELVADEARLDELALLTAPLVARDLPVMLLCRGPRVFSSNVFEPLLRLARKVIVDSCSADDARAALAAVKGMRARCRIADLSWTRITGWREALAYRFEKSPAEPSQIRTASIRYGGAAESCAHYLKHWIERASPSARVELERVENEDSIRAVRVTCDRAEVNIDAAQARGAERGEAELIAEEIAITGADPVFDDLLSRL